MNTDFAVVIGGSAGSLEVFSTFLPRLPADFLLPILAVVHLPPDKKSVLPQLLQKKCVLPVREAQDKEPILPGSIYFAPPDYHLLVEKDYRLSLSFDEPRMFSRPSIDVLFESASDVYGKNLIGILLSGANDDGASGLAEIARQGGRVAVQSLEEAFSTAMPGAGLKACPEARVLKANEIAEFLMELQLS